MLLLLFSLLAGYPSSLTLGSAMWGNSPNAFVNLLALVGFSSAVVAFLAAMVIFFSTAVAGVTSAPESPARDPAQPAQTTLGSDEHFGLTTLERERFHLALRCILLGIVAVNLYYQSLRTGWPLNSGSRDMLWICLIDQVPFVIALQRTWDAPNPPALALILATSIEQIVFVLVFGNNHNPALGLWGNIALPLNVAVVVFVGWVWARFPRLRPSFGLLISIFPALAVYTSVSRLLFGLLKRW